MYDNFVLELVFFFKIRFFVYLYVLCFYFVRNFKFFDVGLGFFDEFYEEIFLLFIFLLLLYVLYGCCCIRIGGRIFMVFVGMVILCYGDLKGG